MRRCYLVLHVQVAVQLHLGLLQQLVEALDGAVDGGELGADGLLLQRELQHLVHTVLRLATHHTRLHADAAPLRGARVVAHGCCRQQARKVTQNYIHLKK